MLKNLKKVAAIVLSFAMAVQFGFADSYYVNAVEEPVEPQQQEETTTTAPQEQEQVPTTEEETPQQQEEYAPAAEETNEQSAPETKSVELSYVAEDGTVLHETASRDFNLDYSLKTDSSVMLNFDGYTLKDVIINNSQTVPADQANLSVTSDLVSVKFVYVSVNTKEDKQTSENNEQTKTEEANEDDAEADPETKEELPEYPAFDQSETAGNVVVHATAAEGVLPRDSKLVVKRITRKAILNAVEDTVSEKNKEMDSAVALDITIQNKDGVEIQPNGSVNISFENAAVSGDEINIYHVTDDASAVTEVATNTQSFDANHFSIYVITGVNDVPLTTFNFVVNDTTVSKPTTVSTQIVRSGDTLIAPTAPDVAGKAFVEWQENGTKFDGFGVQKITKTETRTITAKYENALYVYFYNPEGTQIMRTEKVEDHKDHDYSHVSYDVDATHKLVGWAEKQNGTDDITKNIAVPEGSTSVNVYAIIQEGHWVTFDSDGGSAIDSQFVLDGNELTLNKSTTPTKPGYEFVGWYDGLTKVEDGSAVTTPMTLKAHWNATEVSYTVIHWWENADDDGYSFHESENKTGMTGKEANAKVKSYDGFTAQPVTKKTIKGDGSTIVSVYYKRNVYEVQFYSYTTYNWWGGLDKPSKEYEDLRITAKYGQDISKKWPTKSGSSTWSTTDDDNNGPFQVNIATMPLGGAKFYGPKTGYGSETAYYYVEALPGEPSEVTKDGIQYKLDHKDTSPGTGYTVSKEDQYPLTGYTFNDNISTKTGKGYDNAKFYYTRNSYDLKFINNGKQDKTVTKKYEQSISSENYTPVRPSSLADYYEFDGWYDNELCEGDAFDFSGKKMPAQNVTLYAKWTAKKIGLTYNLNNPKGKVDEGTKQVEAGTVASIVLPSIPTINEYSFAGWYYADGNGNITSEVFHTGSTITRDISIVGKWLYKGELRVAYNPGTEKGATVPTDDRVYAGGARVTVAGNATTTSGKKFLGWELNRNVYMPGQSFEVNKDIAHNDNQIILTATWGNAETSTTLTYDPGNGIGTTTTVDVMNNEAVQIEAHDSNVLGFTAPVADGKEYYFAGWATSMDDANNGKVTYAAGQTVRVDVNDENVLYATWVKKTVIEVTAPADVKYSGKSQQQKPVVKDGEKVLEESKDYSLSYSDDVTNAGTVTITVTGKGNYSGKFEVTYKINPRKVTLKSTTASKPYDGTALTKPAVTVSGDGFVEGEVSDIKATGSVTTVSEGKVTNTITYTPSDKFKEKNYTITKHEGELSITEKSIIPDGPNTPEEKKTGIKVTAPKDTKYNGKEQKKEPVIEDTKTGKTLDKDDYSLSYSDDVTNAGTVTITVTGKGNYSGKFEVTYKINPRKVTLKSETASKPYDGTVLTKPAVTVSGDGFVEGEVSDIKATGSVTTVSEGEVTNTITFTKGKDYKDANYKIEKEEGKLSITAKSIVPDGPNTPEEKKTGITVSEPSDSMYDGKEHKEVLTVTDTKTGKELVAGTDYSVTYSSDLVNAGTVKVTVAGLGNYSGSFTKTYKITKRSVTLTSATVSKVYDGSALTNTSITVSGDGFVEGEGASYEVTGSQTEVGNGANAFEYKLNEKTLASNYNITKVVGTLTITAAPAPVTPATPSTPSTPSSTTSTTLRTPSAPQVTTPVETVEKETTPKAEPKKEEKVEEEYTPKASPQYYWALINLICAILTVLFGLLLLISKRHKSEDDDEEDDETKQQTTNDDEEKEQEKKRGLFTRVLAVLIAIVSVVFFLVTEDLSLPWTWTDQWTIWMVVIGLVQIVVFFVGRKWKNVDNDDEDEEAQQA